MIEIRSEIMEVKAEFTGEEFVVNVVIGSLNGDIPESLDDLTPPASATETTPSDTDTLVVHKGVTGWFTFTWAKLVEWLGTYFSPFRIAAPVASYDDVAAEDTLQDLAGKVLGSQLTKLIDLTLTAPEYVLEFTQDDKGNNLSIYRELVIQFDIRAFENDVGNPVSSRMGIRLNGITTGYNWGSTLNFSIINVMGVFGFLLYLSFKQKIVLQKDL